MQCKKVDWKLVLLSTSPILIWVSMRRKKWAMYVSMNWQNDKSQASRNCQDCLMSKWTITHVTFKGNPSSQILFTNSLQITNTWYSALWFSIYYILLLFHVLHSILINNLDKKLSWGYDKNHLNPFYTQLGIPIQTKFSI